MKVIFIIILFSLSCYSQNIDYKKFIGEPIKIDQKMQLRAPYILDYKLDTSNKLDSIISSPLSIDIAEKLLSDKYELLLINDDDSIQNFIRLKSKLSFQHEGLLTSIIKYNVVKDNIVSKVESIQTQKVNNQWNEVSIDNLISIQIIQELTIDAFWEFYNNEDNPEYPEINKLKPLVKDSNGILNIEKLAQVIEENKNALSKYMDN